MKVAQRKVEPDYRIHKSTHKIHINNLYNTGCSFLARQLAVKQATSLLRNVHSAALIVLL
jgi:hypothetical protein